MVMKMNVFLLFLSYFNLFVTLLQDDCPSDPCMLRNLLYLYFFSQVYFLGPFYIIFCTDLLPI